MFELTFCFRDHRDPDVMKGNILFKEIMPHPSVFSNEQSKMREHSYIHWHEVNA